MNEIYAVIGHIHHRDAIKNAEAKIGREFTSSYRLDHLALFADDMRAVILQHAERLAKIPSDSRALVIYTQHPFMLEACVDYAGWEDNEAAIRAAVEACADHVLRINPDGSVESLGETKAWSQFQSTAPRGYMHMHECLIVCGFWPTRADGGSSRVITAQTNVLGGKDGSQ